MKAEKACYLCCEKKVQSILKQFAVEDEKQKEVLQQIKSYLETASEEMSAPELMGNALQIFKKTTGIEDAYARQKQRYNQLLLTKIESLKEELQSENDLLYAAVQMALVGNYIDFGAMDDVDEGKLDDLLKERKNIALDDATYRIFYKELEQAKSVVYITDNAGEIVLDRLLVEAILKCFPSLQLTILARGEEVLNDATVKDANEVGFPKCVRVISNGTYYPGTLLKKLPNDIKKIIDQADICIAKGQGNFESLCGTGLPVYYLFLCKCSMFVNRFQVNQFAPIFKKETELRIMDQEEHI